MSEWTETVEFTCSLCGEPMVVWRAPSARISWACCDSCADKVRSYAMGKVVEFDTPLLERGSGVCDGR